MIKISEITQDKWVFVGKWPQKYFSLSSWALSGFTENINFQLGLDLVISYEMLILDSNFFIKQKDFNIYLELVEKLKSSEFSEKWLAQFVLEFTKVIGLIESEIANLKSSQNNSFEVLSDYFKTYGKLSFFLDFGLFD